MPQNTLTFHLHKVHFQLFNLKFQIFNLNITLLNVSVLHSQGAIQDTPLLWLCIRQIKNLVSWTSPLPVMSPWYPQMQVNTTCCRALQGKAHLNECRQSGKLFCGYMKFILENMDRAYCGLKRRWTMHLVISTLFESLILKGWISAYGISSLHIWKCITNAERHILYCCFKTCTFPCIKIMLNPLQHVSQLNCWTDLPAVRTFYQLKIFGVLWAPPPKKKIKNQEKGGTTFISYNSSNWSPHFPDGL